MDPKLQTSFIPKKPLVAEVTRRHGPINFFLLLAILILITAIAGSGALFFWEQVITKDIEANRATLDADKKRFDPGFIEDISRLNTRINTADALLRDHVAVSNIFNLVESITLQSVRFTTLELSLIDKSKITLSLQGQAQGYRGVALQSDVLNSEKNISQPNVTGLTLSKNGDVTFSVSASVNPKVLLYADSAPEVVAPASSTPQH